MFKVHLENFTTTCNLHGELWETFRANPSTPALGLPSAMNETVLSSGRARKGLWLSIVQDMTAELCSIIIFEKNKKGNEGPIWVLTWQGTEFQKWCLVCRLIKAPPAWERPKCTCNLSDRLCPKIFFFVLNHPNRLCATRVSFKIQGDEASSLQF